MLERLRLDGKRVVITGGGTGLGRAMVQAMAKAGASICIAARRREPIEEAASEAVKLGAPRAFAVQCDVTVSGQVDAMIARAISELGGVDVLFNNAGIVRHHRAKPVWEITDEEWREGIDVNLSSAFYGTRAVARHMVERGKGKIVNTSSGFGLRGGRDMWMYNAAKAGVLNLTRATVMTLSRHGITANTIVPGFILTGAEDPTRTNLPREEFIPVGYVSKPPTVGPVAVFLASDASDYMNGEMIVVDGGGTAGGLAPTLYAPEVPLRLPQ